MWGHFIRIHSSRHYGLFTLTETDSGTDSDLNFEPDGYIVLCRTFHNSQTRTRIPTPYFCIGRESVSASVPISESCNVFKPLDPMRVFTSAPPGLRLGNS